MVLVEIAEFFVERLPVEALAAKLLSHSAPKGPAYVEQQQESGVPWHIIALEAMRIW